MPLELTSTSAPTAAPGWHDSSRPIPLKLPSRVTEPHSSLLPAQPTPLVGREGELDLALRTVVRDEVRLLTFTGPAGAGKTRLAIATANSLVDLFEDGVHLVDLAPLNDFNQVCAAIAYALGVREAPDEPLLARLIARLVDARALLVLDNFEHVLPAAGYVATLLAQCPAIKILATSRESLRLRWEYVFPVGPLALPAPAAVIDPVTASESPAVQLFVNRAKAADATFELTVANAPAVAELCGRLDGLPLALELAAARSPLLPPSALLARLGHRLDLLADGASDLPPRQRSVRAAIGYSYELLSDEEQTLFRQLAVFAGSCTPDAAAAVAQSVDGDATVSPVDRGFGPILGRLAALVHKSLLTQEPQPDGDIRFRMLETIRAYATERLVVSGEMAEARLRALGYYTALAERAQSGLRGRDQATWLAVLDCEHDNIRAALRWCLESGDADGGLGLAGRLGRFWELRGLYTEGRTWLIDLLALAQPAGRTPARARALSAAGDLAASQGDDPGAEAYESESLAIYRELRDREGIAASLSALGLLAHRRGDAVRARAMLEESLTVSRELGDQWAIASVLHHLGDLASEPGQYAMARARYEESLIQWHALGDNWGAAMCLESMGCMLQARGHAARALQLIGAGSAVRDSVRSSLKAPVQRLRLQQTIAAAESALGMDAAAAALAAGRAMSLDEAVLCARTVQDRVAALQPAPLPPDSPLAWLTRREQEVAALLLRGLSNRMIAEELVITERTAETHVCRILSKLGLGSRAQIAAWVTDRSVVKDRRSVS